MKVILVSVFYLATVQMVTSQSKGFNKTYDVDFCTQWLLNVIQSEDSNYIAVGASNNCKTTGLYKFNGYQIIKVNGKGDTLFNKLYYKTAINYVVGFGSLIQTNDGDFAFAGYYTDTSGLSSGQAMLVKFDLNGDTVWTRSYGAKNTWEVFYGCRETNDGGFILLGKSQVYKPQVQQSDIYLVKTDNFGIVQWQKVYDVAYYDEGFSVELTSDGGYVIGGSAHNNITDHVGIIIKTDSMGNKQWQHSLFFGGGGTCWAFQSSDGHYIAYGSKTDKFLYGKSYGYMAKINEPYKTFWVRTFDVDYLIGAYELADSTFIAAGSYKHNDQGCIINISSKGDSLWLVSYSTDNNKRGRFYDLAPTLDNGFIMAGTARDSTQDGWLVKVDSLGCIVSGCNSIVTQTFQHESALNSIKIYPNPFINWATVEMNLAQPAHNGQLKFILYNIYGQKENIIDVPDFSKDVIKFRLYRNDHSTGLYFYKLFQGDKTIAYGKVVIN